VVVLQVGSCTSCVGPAHLVLKCKFGYHFPHPNQDDEVPPSGCKWVRDVVAIFSGHPMLGALGLRNYKLNRVSGNL